MDLRLILKGFFVQPSKGRWMSLLGKINAKPLQGKENKTITTII